MIRRDMSVPYTVVLTHDLDTVGLREIPLSSRTFWGFPYRCIVENARRLKKGDMDFQEYLGSFAWGISSLGIKLGIVRDPWLKSFQRMIELEESLGVRSTLFVMPFHDEPGHLGDGSVAPAKRSAHYRLEEWGEYLRRLADRGWELACHGIDCHVSAEAARREYLRCCKAFGSTSVGLRMHWLTRTDDLWNNAKTAGFAYDASLGWNDQIGFPEGRDRPFEDEVSGLPVIPLNIQDSAILAEQRLGLTRREAFEMIDRVMDTAHERQAVLTVLWHSNSFGPPRYWEEPYAKIIKRAKSDGARITRACDVLREDELSVSARV